MNKLEKGQFGYLSWKKKSQLIKTCLMFLIAAAIFVLGLAINDWSKSNVYTIIAALAVLPAAKQMVGFLVLFPYTSISLAKYQQYLESTKPEDTVFTDVVCSSSEKVMKLDMLVISGNHLIGFMHHNCKNRSYMERYLRENFKLRSYGARIHIYEEESKFISAIKAPSNVAVEEEVKKEWVAYLKSLMV